MSDELKFPAYPRPKEMYYAISSFMEGHKGADEIICRQTDGMPLCAVYYFPPGTHASEVRSFFKRVQELSEPPLSWDDESRSEDSP